MIHPDKQRVNLLLNSIYLIIFLSFFIQCNRVSNRSTDKSLISADSTKHSSQNSGQTEISNTKTDSLKILLENVKSDTARIHILDELAIAEEEDIIGKSKSLLRRFYQQNYQLRKKSRAKNITFHFQESRL